MRPPGRVTRANSCTAACRSGTCCSTATQNVESKQASANGRWSASAAATFSLILCADPACAVSLALSTSRSIANSATCEMCSRPSITSAVPSPHPTSRMRVPGTRAERLAEELGKVAVPPAIAQVLEGRGREGVHVSGHQGLLVRFASSASKRTRPPRRHARRAAGASANVPAGLYLADVARSRAARPTTRARPVRTRACTC